MTNHTTEICIVGAGPGGATAALVLGRAGVPCLLVDKADFPRDKICGDALSGKVVEVLKKIDPSIAQRLAAEPTQVGSWGVNFIAPNGKALRVPFKTSINKASDAAPGFIIKRFDFDHFLLQEALKYPSVTYVPNLKLEKYTKTTDGYIAADKDGTITISTKLLLVADGAQSSFARHHGGIQMEPKHYCAGIRAYYEGVQGMDADNFIELHFIKELLPGYFWIFPLPNGGANVGLGVRSDYISKRKLNLKQLLPQVIEGNPVLKKRFERATLVDEVRGYGLPLGSKKRPISGDNYMLIGDAASLIDPFTGEGIGNAMMTGMLAAQQAIASSNFTKASVAVYDTAVYRRLWSELSLSRKMQQLVTVPWLFNLVVNKAQKSKTLQETISCMFEDMDMRERLKQPSFYVNLLLNK
jgi:geranylgeranyl reductase family protein